MSLSLYPHSSSARSVVVKVYGLYSIHHKSTEQSYKNRKNGHFCEHAFSFKSPPRDFSQKDTPIKSKHGNLQTREPRPFDRYSKHTNPSEMRPRLSSHSRHARSRAMHHREQESSENIRGSNRAAKLNIIYNSRFFL